MPVNMPTHAHGQGYTDLNFLIPELVSGVQYKKGPYFAEDGDFTTAGAANINYVEHAREAGGPRPGRVGPVPAGPRRWARPGSASGNLLDALEGVHNDGPWVNPDDYRKVNGVLRYSVGDAQNGFSITGMGYQASWNSTDQIPQRAVDDGEIGRFGAIDPTDGGEAQRYSLSAEYQRSDDELDDARRGLRHRLQARPLLELHLLPRRSRARRPVRAGRRPRRVRREGDAPVDGDAGPASTSRTRSASRAASTTSTRSASTTPRIASASRRRASTGSSRAARALFFQNDTQWSDHVPDDPRPAGRPLPLRRHGHERSRRTAERGRRASSARSSP